MENTKKFGTKNIIIFIVLALISVAIVLAVIFSLNSSVVFDDTKDIAENFSVAHTREDKPILYIKNGALYSKASDGSGDSIEISQNLCAGNIVESSSTYINLVKQSKTAEATYFIKDFSKDDYRGSLYVTTDYKTAAKIDTDVVVEEGYEYLKMSDNGKSVVYMKNLVITDDELYADLYYKNIDDDSSPVLIANELYGMKTEYLISPTGEYIAAYSDYNDDKDVGGLYILKNGETAKTIILENTKNVSLKSITNDGKLIYTAATIDNSGNELGESVYIINHEDMQKKAYGNSVDRQNVFVSDKSDKIVFIEQTGENIFAYAASYTSEPVLITDKYYGFTSLDVENDCYIYAEAIGDEKYETDKKVYIKTPELKEPALLCNKILLPSHVKNSVDYKNIYYLTDSFLYYTQVIDGQLSKPEKIAENVYDYKISQGGNSVVMTSNYNEETKTADLKSYTKKTKKVSDIASGLKLEYVNLSADGLAVVYAHELTTGQANGFTAKLSHFDFYGKNEITEIDKNASMLLYYYDQYLASTSTANVIPRNRYYVRSGNSILYYTEVGSDCASGNLILYKDGKQIQIDSDVNAVLFE